MGRMRKYDHLIYLLTIIIGWGFVGTKMEKVPLYRKDLDWFIALFPINILA